MENIKNTTEDIGKIVVRISNKLAFAYTWEPDHVFINDDMNNYRYATKEEVAIYNTNKSPDDRFYSLLNAPELRHEILKERVDALHEVYKHISADTMYKLVTSDMSRKYWQHELNESKDKEIAALNKQVASLIKYKDSLTKDLLNSDTLLKAETASYCKLYKKYEKFEKIDKSFIIDALNFYCHDAYKNLERNDLGDIEKKNYELQEKISKEQMNILQ